MLLTSDEDICWLEIPMDNIFACKIEVSRNDLLHEGDDLSFVEAFFDSFVEVRLTKLSDDVGIIFSGVYLVKCQDVIQRLQLFQHLNLALQQNFIDFVFKHSEIDNFDGNTLTVLIMPALIDMAGVSLSNNIIETVGVPLNLLACETARHVSFWKIKNNNI